MSSRLCVSMFVWGGLLALIGCTSDGGPLVKDTARIVYEEIGVCNGFQGPTLDGPTPTTSAGPKKAFVVVRIKTLDNSKSSQPFVFDPSKLFLNSSSPRSFADMSASASLRGSFSMASTTIPAGESRSFMTGDVLFVGDSETVSGADGARNIAFTVSYEPVTAVPGVFLDNKKNGITTFPVQSDCRLLPY